MINDNLIDSREIDNWLIDTDVNDWEYLAIRNIKRDLIGLYGETRFESGLTLIADKFFAQYAREFASDIHGVELDSWPFDEINWTDAVDNLKMDYTTIEASGFEFWIRS